MTHAPEPAQVLIIDDDTMLRGMAARTLQHAGFGVTQAADGEGALALLAHRSFDLVMLDVMMPGMDGYEVCRRIRALPQGAQVPILMLTGLNDPESIELAFSHGATDFITKPITWALLSHKVRYALRASTAQERIRELAHYDAITGLPNRQFFAQLAGPSLERTQRVGKRCAVMSLDVDRFKAVNDAFGRSGGDEVLKTLAERLRSWIRASDLASVGQAPADHGVLASGGGSSFTLLIADLESQEQATAVAQRLLQAVSEPILVESQSLVLTASIGIAFFPNDAADFAGLSRCAEQAVHAAQDGRGQHRFFDERMNAHAARKLVLETELRRAIACGELRLHFQPKVDAATAIIVGAEALVRWQHPERGLLAPGEFIALAEETGLILPLTDWVVEAACRHLRDWLDAGLAVVPLSVNLSAASISCATLPDMLDGCVARFALTPQCLTLEMTETMLMSDANAAITQLERLRAHGYGLSLDDFGTGYSSLSYLKRFPVDELKIDRAFVTDVERGGRDAALAAAIIALSRELGLRVVAEGVETRAQSEFLLKRGCRLQQGYLFSKPLPATAFAQLLRTASPASSESGT